LVSEAHQQTHATPLTRGLHRMLTRLLRRSLLHRRHHCVNGVAYAHRALEVPLQTEKRECSTKGALQVGLKSTMNALDLTDTRQRHPLPDTPEQKGYSLERQASCDYVDWNGPH
jgi:hypothetical protein